MVNVAVLGYGTIGSGVVEVLQTNTEVIAQRAGEEIAVKYILDLRDFPGDPNADKIVHDYDIIDKDEDVQVVVECMGGVEPAYTFVKRALLNGRSVATSNKELVAKHGAELIAIAHEKNINFLFEASVGGGAVKVVVNGNKEFKSIEISPAAVDPDDVEMLQDLILSAVNEAVRLANETMEKEMSKVTGGLGNLGGFGF